jgi:hypothetical protein
MARPSARERIGRPRFRRKREVLKMQWKPSLRLLLVVAVLLAFAMALGSVDLAAFLEW